MFSQTLGLTLFFSIVFPFAPYWLHWLTGGMYGGFFRNYSPIVFLAVSLFFTYLIPLILTLIFVKTCDIKNRMTISTVSRNLFLIGAVLIITPQLLRLYTSTISGGVATYTLIPLSAPFITIGRIIVIIGAIKFFMSLEPEG